MIVGTFTFEGELYLVLATGLVYRIETKGEAEPAHWDFELASNLRA